MVTLSAWKRSPKMGLNFVCGRGEYAKTQRCFRDIPRCSQPEKRPFELLSKLLVSPLITPIVVPYNPLLGVETIAFGTVFCTN